MKSKELDYDVKFMTIFIKSVAIIFRWVCLINCVFFTGLSVALLVMFIVKGNNITLTLLSTMVELLTKFEAGQVYPLVDSIGIPKLVLAVVCYGASLAIYNGLVYSLVQKFLNIYDTIVAGNMFTKENVDLINKSVLEAILAAFITPLTIIAVYTSTKVFSLNEINVSGILFIFIVYITKLVFTKGYELESINEAKRRELNELKANMNEEKIATIKKETEVLNKNTVSKKPVAKKKINKKTTTK